MRFTGYHLITSPDFPNFTGVLVDISGVKYVLCLRIRISMIMLSSNRYYARVEKVYPPKYSSDEKARDAHKDPSSSSASSLEDEALHVIGGDLKIPVKDANARDDPMLYYYWVHILELEKDKSHSKDKTAAREAEKDAKLIGSVMEVQCPMMR